MSGRYTFVAGTDATANQMNSYVMDGIPYKIQVGTTTVGYTSNASWSYGSTNVTNLSGFTVQPYVVGSVETTVTTLPNVCQFNVTGTTTMTVIAMRAGASTANIAVRWIAIQGTAATAAGS